MRLNTRVPFRRCLFLALALSAAVLGLGASGASAGSSFTYSVHPIYNPAFAGRTTAFPTPSECVANYGSACYTPALIRTAYNVPGDLTGKGQTIVLVEAYGSPTIQQDLATFDEAFRLPDPTLNIIYPGGKPPFNPKRAHGEEVGWAFETSLDVEWAHAIAPDATIDLVVAANSAGNVLNNAQAYAVDRRLGNVMSLTFLAPEGAIHGNNDQTKQSHKVYEDAQAAGITVFAVAGDAGASNGYSFANATYPASDPLVTGVGGTSLFIDDNGTYGSENVWNDADACPFGSCSGVLGATGGAPSSLFPAPPWQSGSARTVADVAYDASPYTAFSTYASFPGLDPGFYFAGGTSAGAPQWAAIIALADEAAGRSLGYLNPTLYGIASDSSEYAADFHDIVQGGNAFGGPGFDAGTGYDMPTGLGTPNVANLITTLAGL